MKILQNIHEIYLKQSEKKSSSKIIIIIIIVNNISVNRLWAKLNIPAVRSEIFIFMDKVSVGVIPLMRVC